MLFGLQLVQFANQIVIKHVIVPDGDKEGEGGVEQTLDAANVGEQVQNVVALSFVLFRVKVHLDLKVKLGVVVLFVRPVCNTINGEDAIVFYLSHGIKIYGVVLKVDRRHLKLISDAVLNLSVDRRIYEPACTNDCFLV